MDPLSRNIVSVLLPFAELFSKPSWKNALTLLLGTLICRGRRTICSVLRAMNLSDEIGFAKFHHLLNRTRWSPLRGAQILLFMLLTFIPNTSPIVLLIDETLERRKGKKIGNYSDTPSPYETST